MVLYFIEKFKYVMLYLGKNRYVHLHSFFLFLSFSIGVFMGVATEVFCWECFSPRLPYPPFWYGMSNAPVASVDVEKNCCG